MMKAIVPLPSQSRTLRILETREPLKLPEASLQATERRQMWVGWRLEGDSVSRAQGCPASNGPRCGNAPASPAGPYFPSVWGQMERVSVVPAPRPLPLLWSLGQVCDEPHPLLVKEMIQHCVDAHIDEAYKVRPPPTRDPESFPLPPLPPRALSQPH